MGKHKRGAAARSYSVGEWGANRVRVYERAGRGFWVDYTTEDTDSAQTRRRTRRPLDVADWSSAKAEAERIAARLRVADTLRPARLTLAKLFELYRTDTSPHKGASKQAHDARCAEMFVRFFGASTDPSTLSRRELDRFIVARRAGVVAPEKARKRRQVGDRVIGYDCRCLVAALTWATLAGDGKGNPLLERNPLRGIRLPSEESPNRPILTTEEYEGMRKAARAVHTLCEPLLVTIHETGHRVSSVRHLRWSDVDFTAGVIRWPKEHDKIGFAHETLLSADAKAVLQGWQRRRQTDGGVLPTGSQWVFPSPKRPKEAVSRHTLNHWFSAMVKAAKVPARRGLGYHSLRRKFATELKGESLKDTAYLGGWKSIRTLTEVYQAPDTATQRAVLERRKQLRADGLA